MTKTNTLSSKAVGLLMMSCFLGGSFSFIADANALTALRSDTKAPVVITAVTINKLPALAKLKLTGAQIDQLGPLVKQAGVTMKVADLTINKLPTLAGLKLTGAQIDQLGPLVQRAGKITGIDPLKLANTFAFTAVDGKGVKYIVSFNNAGTIVLDPVLAGKASK